MYCVKLKRYTFDEIACFDLTQGRQLLIYIYVCIYAKRALSYAISMGDLLSKLWKVRKFQS